MHRFYNKVLYCIIALLCLAINSQAQSLLDKPVTVEAKRRAVKDVLDIIGKRCNFSFSYNSDLVPADSLVTLNAVNKPVRQVLETMFGDAYHYKEMDNHVVILPAEKEKWFTVHGNVADAMTGLRVADVSVFDRQQLTSTLTDADGNFRLRLKDKGKYAVAEIVFSKGGFYSDTSVSIVQGYDQEITITLHPTDHTLPDVMITQYGMEKSWLGRILFSEKLRKQSANLSKFFVDKPMQASLIPGLGTHGKLSGQVTNKVSFNILGGYAAGVDGVEIGGLFNVDKKDVQYVQVGGLFNVVTGNVTGVQVGGLINRIGGSVSGVQVGGVINIVNDSFSGVQIGGITNRDQNFTQGFVVAGINNKGFGHVEGMQLAGIINKIEKCDTAKIQDTTYAIEGFQLAGITNNVTGRGRGFQLAGIKNVCSDGMKGLQMSAIYNRTGVLEGSQIALINVCDTVTGYCVGLLNIVKKGYHTVAISTNELTNLTVAYKTGTKKLYSIITASINTPERGRIYTSGIGVGTELKLSNKTGIALEFTVEDIYWQNQFNRGTLLKATPTFNWNITRKFSLFTGPSISMIPNMPELSEDGCRRAVPQNAIYNVSSDKYIASWVGWHVGFHIF